MKLLKSISVSILVLAGLAVAGVFVFGPSYFDSNSNNVMEVKLPALAPETEEFHKTLTVIDMHNDILLWNRDPLKRYSYGHTDVPRLIEGNVSLQIFAAVTKSPAGLNYESNPSDSDTITSLAFFQRWPVGTWGSLKERAIYQAEKLHNAAENSDGKLRIIKTVSDLDRYLEERSDNPSTTSGMLAIEGLHALDGRFKNLDELYDAGYRMMGLTHFFDNEIAGSAHGLEKGGLTSLGKQIFTRMEELGIIVDLAHLSPEGIDEILATATKPVVVSHTGVQATCPGVRNLTDEQILRIGKNRGVIGLGYWRGAICDVSPKSFARAARHIADLVGADHIGLGSDFDGYVTTGIDTSQLVYISQALLDANFSEQEVRKIMGGNTLRLFREVLPR